MLIEPGELCERELPCEARFELKWWRLMAPEKPLPLVVPVTSTICPTAKVSTLTVSPTLRLGELLGGDRKFLQQLARLDAGLGEMPGLRLGDAARAALAVGDLHGGVAVGLLAS